jgi:hypothetical protein
MKNTCVIFFSQQIASISALIPYHQCNQSGLGILNIHTSVPYSLMSSIFAEAVVQLLQKTEIHLVCSSPRRPETDYFSSWIFQMTLNLLILVYPSQMPET